MEVFISWSKEKSMEYAIATKKVLEAINPDINAFVSEVDINGGEDVQRKIIDRIVNCDKLVLCFTKENKLSPWLLFEAGYAKGLKKIVVPILFDDDLNWHSWIDNPMNIAKELRYNKRDFERNLINCFCRNNQIDKGAFTEYTYEIEKIKEKYSPVDLECMDLVNELIHNDAFVMKNPYFEDKSAFFLSGFESYDLLKVITRNFLYSGKYLWIYGRKNMKLFGGSFKEFFSYLHEKFSSINPSMDGIDFKCLFLDPLSDEVGRAHLQPEILKAELEATILRAKAEIGCNDLLRECFRKYTNRREEIIIRLDNSIIYSRPSFDSNGRPQLLTNTSFEVCSIKSKRGSECLKKFEQVWCNSTALF